MNCVYNNDKFCDVFKKWCSNPGFHCIGYKDKKDCTNGVANIYCEYCFNARVYTPTEEERMNPFITEMTDENDSSSITVGKSGKHGRFMISSGHGEPVRIEFDQWSESRNEWATIGKYYPKYCPECGRRLNEYEVC